jgi:hypothetical protein
MGRDLTIVKIAAFHNELEKLGIGEGIAVKLLFKTLPKLLSAFGRSGGATSKFLTAAGKQGLSARATVAKGIDAVAKNMGPVGSRLDYSKVKLNTRMAGSPKHRPWFGKSKGAIQKAPVGQKSRYSGFKEDPVNWLKTRPQAWTGEAAQNLKFIKDKGVGRFIKHEFTKGRTYVNRGHIYKRSLVGQAGGTAFSGLGFGAMTLAEKTNPATGQSYSAGRRLARGAAEAAGWTAAPGLMMGKMTIGMGKDLFKSIIKKPAQNYSLNY